MQFYISKEDGETNKLANSYLSFRQIFRLIPISHQTAAVFESLFPKGTLKYQLIDDKRVNRICVYLLPHFFALYECTQVQISSRSNSKLF